MIESPPHQGHIAEDLFNDYTFLRGFVGAILIGEMGTAFVDDVEHSAVGHLILVWARMLAYDPTNEAIKAVLREMLSGTSPNAVIANRGNTFRRIWATELVDRRRG